MWGGVPHSSLRGCYFVSRENNHLIHLMNKTKSFISLYKSGEVVGVTQRGFAELVVRGCRGAGG